MRVATWPSTPRLLQTSVMRRMPRSSSRSWEQSSQPLLPYGYVWSSPLTSPIGDGQGWGSPDVRSGVVAQAECALYQPEARNASSSNQAEQESEHLGCDLPSIHFHWRAHPSHDSSHRWIRENDYKPAIFHSSSLYHHAKALLEELHVFLMKKAIEKIPTFALFWNEDSADEDYPV